MTPSKVLILGATGYIGGVLCRTFSNEGFGVYVLARPTSRVESIAPWCDKIIRTPQADTTREDVRRAVLEFGIDTVINCAWNMPPADTQEAQYAKDRVALEASLYGAQEASPEVHVITSSGNFSLITDAGGTITEAAPPRGFSRPKYMAWSALLSGVNVFKDALTAEFIEQGGNASILFPSSVYGPAPTRGGFWDFALQQFISGQPYWGFAPFPPNFMTAWVHVEDLARCYVAAARRRAPGGRYLAAPENLSIGQMASRFAAAAGVDFEPPEFVNVDSVRFDDSRTRAELNLTWRCSVDRDVPAWVEWIRELGALSLQPKAVA